jgi:hypothetical protein
LAQVIIEISKLTNKKEEMDLALGRLAALVNEKAQMNKSLHNSINLAEFEKQKLITRINVFNSFMKGCQSISETGTSIDNPEVQRQASKIEIKMNNLMDVISNLKLEHVQYQEAISRIEILLYELKEIKIIYKPMQCISEKCH